MPEYTRPRSIAPADIGLMLRAHAELSCLRLEVIPVLRQIETRSGLPDEQLGAALAYLEVTWMHARRRAQETDTAREVLLATSGGETLCEQDAPVQNDACRYHEAVIDLRDIVAMRIAPLLASPDSDLEMQAAAQPARSPAPGRHPARPA